MLTDAVHTHPPTLTQIQPRVRVNPRESQTNPQIRSRGGGGEERKKKGRVFAGIVCPEVRVYMFKSRGERETEYIMAKTHKGPCARGTIHYANEAPPYGESQLKAPHTHTHTEHVYTQEPSAAFPHFHAKSAKPCNKQSLLSLRQRVGGRTRGKTEREERVKDGWGGKRQKLNRGNKRNQPTPSSSTD